MTGTPGPDHGADPLPGLPGGRLRPVLLALLIAVIAGDFLWLKGALFGSVLWRALLWVLVAIGLAIGIYAYRRRQP